MKVSGQSFISGGNFTGARSIGGWVDFGTHLNAAHDTTISSPCRELNIDSAVIKPVSLSESAELSL
jgi:hypothetical protein